MYFIHWKFGIGVGSYSNIMAKKNKKNKMSFITTLWQKNSSFRGHWHGFASSRDCILIGQKLVATCIMIQFFFSFHKFFLSTEILKWTFQNNNQQSINLQFFYSYMVFIMVLYIWWIKGLWACPLLLAFWKIISSWNLPIYYYVW